MADIEGTYEKHSKWEKTTIAEDAVWALMLGLEIKIKDAEGNIVMDTEKAVSTLSPLIKRRDL
jgi:two-component system sensor histidine kinase BaeS